MTWFKVDDQLHEHRKPRMAGKAAMGVWTLAGSWAMDNEMDGFIPAGVISRWGNKADAAKLVEAGLWFPDEYKGEPGWRFHAWDEFQPSAETMAAWRAAESDAGQRGNHKRWHVDRGISVPDCAFCYQIPDGVPDQEGDQGTGSGNDRGGRRVSIARNPDPNPNTTSSNEEVGPPEPRPDVERLCKRLADAVEANGSKRPSVTKAWRDAARLLIDKDGRTEDQIAAAIDWCQNGDTERGRFWIPNVMSMTKLRDKYDVLRLQAEQERRSSQPASRFESNLSVVRELEADEQRQIGGG